MYGIAGQICVDMIFHLFIDRCNFEKCIILYLYLELRFAVHTNPLCSVMLYLDSINFIYILNLDIIR